MLDEDSELVHFEMSDPIKVGELPREILEEIASAAAKLTDCLDCFCQGCQDMGASKSSKEFEECYDILRDLLIHIVPNK